MKIVSRHPEIYLRYKDKRMRSHGLNGSIVGYLTYKLDIIYLVLELDDIKSVCSIFKFAKQCDLIVKEYNGDIKKDYILITKEDLEDYTRTFII